MVSEKNSTESEKELLKAFSFWRWWFRYGFLKLFNRWLFLHTVIGVALNYVVKVSLSDAALLVIMPLAGILIGLSFAWVGNAMALLETEEVKLFIDKHQNGLKEYVFSYQGAILLILLSIIIWGLVGLKIQEFHFMKSTDFRIKYVGKIFIFFLTSISIRECWQIVIATQWLLLAKAEIKKLNHKNSQK